MSQGDLWGRKRNLGEEKLDRGGREAAGDGATGRSVKVFQFGDTVLISLKKGRHPSEAYVRTG